MAHTIAALFASIATALALASLWADYRRAMAARRNIRRQLERIKRGEIRWSITERKA